MPQDKDSIIEGEAVKYLKAIMLLQIRQLAEESEQAKIEVLLANAGFTHKEIAGFLGRSREAIAKSISRNKQQQVTNGSEEQ